MESLLGAHLFVRSVLTLFTNFVCGCLHDFVDAHIKVDKLGIDLQLFTVVYFRQGCVIVNVWRSFDRGEMRLGALVVDQLDILVGVQVKSIASRYHVGLPKLVWLNGLLAGGDSCVCLAGACIVDH